MPCIFGFSDYDTSSTQMLVEAGRGQYIHYLSGKGIYRNGFGGKLEDPFSQFWIGTNTIPYYNFGVAGQLEFPLQKNKYIFINGRYGIDHSSSFAEYGISIGIRLTDF